MMQPEPITYPDTRHPLDAVSDERFTIDDDDAANWAMRKLRSIRAQQSTHERLAADEIERVNRWLADVLAPLQRDAAYFEGLLVDYARRCRENPDDGRKTVSLPAGKVTSRQTQPKWTVNDDAFLDWARTAHPDLIRIREEANVSAMKDTLVVTEQNTVVTSDGELVPGVAVAPGVVSFSAAPAL